MALQELRKDDKPMAQFLKEVKMIADALASAGKPLDPEELNSNFFLQLGADYHPVVAGLNYRPNPVSFSELSGHVLAHEQLLQSAKPVIRPNG